ncbi:hypothetical protein DYB32_003662 [Aphanomyces invadans]|uniref:Uncharacterized protein n=1 Tax=Aphanomyces invadans TaxID=157072 RepID=A0A418AZX7_9STRA|nr:hypothetical protein DYB32_003662 [Aphanomyces invadans]
MAVGWVLRQLGPRFRSNNAGDGPEKTRDRKFWFPRFKSTLLGSYRSKATYVLCECALPKVEEKEYAMRLEVSKQYGGMRYDDAVAQHNADVEQYIAHMIPHLPCKFFTCGCFLCDADTSRRYNEPQGEDDDDMAPLPLHMDQRVAHWKDPALVHDYLGCFLDADAVMAEFSEPQTSHYTLQGRNDGSTAMDQVQTCITKQHGIALGDGIRFVRRSNKTQVRIPAIRCWESKVKGESPYFYFVVKMAWVLALAATTVAAIVGATPSSTAAGQRPTALASRARATPPPTRVYPVYPRPTITYPNASWTSCTQTHCAADYHRCVNLFYGDGCSCYPGLLGCAISSCDKAEYAAVLDACYDSLATNGRCALQCAPGYFPVDVVAPSITKNATSAGVSNHTTNVTGVVDDDDTIREPVTIDWTVLATWLLVNTTADQVKSSSKAFVSTLVSFLRADDAAVLSVDNISFHHVSKSTTLQEVSAVVHVSSLTELNATDRALASQLFHQEYIKEGGHKDSDVNEEFDLPDFGDQLVAASVLRHATQLYTDNVKIQVNVCVANSNITTSNSSSTTPPAQHKPAINKSIDQTFLGLTPGVLLVLAAGGAALLALIIACLCLRCRKSSSQDKAAVAVKTSSQAV